MLRLAGGEQRPGVGRGARRLAGRGARRLAGSGRLALFHVPLGGRLAGGGAEDQRVVEWLVRSGGGQRESACGCCERQKRNEAN